MDHSKYAQQNLRVWARRMNVEVDVQVAMDFLNQHYQGSVLKGPLVAVFYKCLRVTEPWAHEVPLDQRMPAAVIAANVLATILRTDKCEKGTVELAQEFVDGLVATNPGVLVVRTYQATLEKNQGVISTLVERALQARNAEKANPNIANLILGKARRPQ